MASSSSPHSAASEPSDSPYLPLSPSHYPTSEFLRRFSLFFQQPQPVGGQLFTAMTTSIFTVAGPLPVPLPSTAAAFQYSEMMAPISSTGTAATLSLPCSVSTGLEALEGLSELRGIMAVLSKIGEVKKGLRENMEELGLLLPKFSSALEGCRQEIIPMGEAEHLSSLGIEIKAKSDQILKLATEKPTVEDLTNLVYELRSKNKVWVTGLDELKAL